MHGPSHILLYIFAHFFQAIVLDQLLIFAVLTYLISNAFEVEYFCPDTTTQSVRNPLVPYRVTQFLKLSLRQGL